MITLNVPIQIRRGTAAAMPSAMLAGELYFQTDTNKLYAGKGTSTPAVQVGGAATSWGTITGTLANQTDLQAALDALTAAIVSEATTRASAVASEASTRSAADTTLQSNITSEASTRASADTTNATAITTETSRAQTAEGLLVPKTRTVAGHALSADVTLAEADITNLTTDLAAKVPNTRSISTTAPLTGGGDLSADRTLAISAFTGDSGSGGAKGAVPAPVTGDSAKFLKGSGAFAAVAEADVTGLVADLALLAPRLNPMAGISLPNVKFISATQRFAAPGIGANNIVYTCPSNRRAILMFVGLYNDTGASSTFQLKLNSLGGGTFYPLAAVSASIAQAGSTSLNAGAGLIMEATDVVVVTNATNTSFNVIAQIVEFDNTANLKSVRIISDGSTTAGNSGKIVNADAIMYQVPVGKNAFLISTPSPLGGLNGSSALQFLNASGGNRTVHLNVFANGGTAGATNQITAATTGTSATNTGFLISFTMASQECLSINSNANTAGQLAFVNVLEISN